MSFDVLCQWGVWDVDSFENPRNRVPLQGHSYPATLLPILENAAVPGKFLESKVRLSLNTNRGKFLVDRSGNVRTPTGEYRLDSEDFALLQSLIVEMNKEFPTAEGRDDTEAESDQAIHRYLPGGTGTPFAFAVQHGCQTDLPGDR